MIEQMWTQSWRPNRVEDFVWKDAAQESQVKSWVARRNFPSMILSGTPGVGKTTLALMLIAELDVDPCDVLIINASRENGVDAMRNKIENFVQTMPFGEFKVVILDEADLISFAGQGILRNTIETYSDTARFILTCNHPHKIMPALHSRCQGFHIDKLDRDYFTARAAEILINENIEFDLDILEKYVAGTYPDLRKCINSIQQASQSGKLELPEEVTGNNDVRVKAVELIQAGKITDARKLLATNTRPDEAEDFYRWLYDNLDLWSSDPATQDRAIIIIRNGIVNHNHVADIELNIAATLCELAELMR
jgi:DNA polymerase III delta prime subunit